MTPEDRLRVAGLAAAAFLEPRTEEIVADLGELLREQLPSYEGETLDTLGDGIRIVLGVALTRLREGGSLEEADAEALWEPARGWADEGRPLDPPSFQLGARRVMSLLAEHAAELEIDDRTLFAMQDRIWGWATMGASILADAQREHLVTLARRDAARRADFLRDLAAGRMTLERLAGDSEAYGLDVGQPYFAVCADCTDCGSGAAVEALEAHVRRSGATADRRALQVVVDGRLLAVTSQVPTVFDGIALAVGPATMLPDAHASFAEAAEALITARAFDITGIVDLGALGPLPLVAEADVLAARLSARHLRELDERGQAGRDIEDTVSTLLELDRNIEATAERLHLHRNSIRYRVRRFRELTGLDLRRTEDLVTTWWLLTRRRSARSAAGRSG
ncbi:MAG: PucR family transcriptional regulator [Solirubrobacteraceae bacterium]